MKIELKNVRFSESQSDETNAFTADIWVDGKKCGYCKNNGCGGETETHGIYTKDNTKMLDLFRQTEEYCKSLPDHTWEYDGKPYSMKSSLESVVDELFSQWLKDRDKKKLEKKMETHIIWGKPNGHSYVQVKFKRPLNQIDKKILQSYLNQYKKEFKEGEQFLNTNLDGFKL